MLGQQIVNGLALGMGYAVAGAGLTIVFGVLRVMNFAHGEFYTLGAYGAVLGTSIIGLSYWLSIPLSLAISVALSIAVYFFLLRPLEGRDADGTGALIVTYGLSLIGLSTIQMVAGPSPRAVPTGLEGIFRLGGIIIPKQQALVIVGGTALFICLGFILQRTPFGRRLRAVADNATGARLVGIAVERLKIAGFTIGTAFVALAGVVVGPVGLITPRSGHSILFISFIVVILGGMGSVAGAAAAGIIVGLVEAMGATYVSSQWTQAYGFVILIMILVFKPQGLAGLKDDIARMRTRIAVSAGRSSQ